MTPDPADAIHHLQRPDGERLAFRHRPGQGPLVLWIGGFRSDMEGTKALALDAAAAAGGWDYVRYDHFAHGLSSGDWDTATIGRWCDDAVALVDHMTRQTGRGVVAVGSSMGGWVALHLALSRPEAMHGLVLVNPAQDFTETLMWPALPTERRAEITATGRTLMPDEGLGAYVLTRRFFEDGRARRLPAGPLPVRCPVHVLQGRRDDSVPWRHQLALVEALEDVDVRLDLIAEGDHRLSEPAQLDRLIRAVAEMRAEP